MYFICQFFFSVRLPIPAYLLALTYFFLSILSLSMLIGLRTRQTRFLLAWILLNLLLICPEAGMVLFMAIYFWVSSFWIIDTLSYIQDISIESISLIWRRVFFKIILLQWFDNFIQQFSSLAYNKKVIAPFCPIWIERHAMQTEIWTFEPDFEKFSTICCYK